LPLFAMATVHMLTAGTDASNPIVTAMAAIVSLTVVALTVWRVATLGRKPKSRVQSQHHARKSVMLNG